MTHIPLWPPTLLLVGAGLVSAMQAGKAPAGLQAIQNELGLPLGIAAWLLSAFGLVGAIGGIAIGTLADRLGLHRTLVAGLLLQGVAAAAGAQAEGAALLLASRGLEGIGFLAVVVAAPALIAQVAAGRPAAGPFAAWSAFMPLGMALALLASPLLLAQGWRALWWASSAAALGYAVLAVWLAPRDAASAPQGPGIRVPVRHTLMARGPLALALLFLLFAGGWFALFGLLPAVLDSGIAATPAQANLLTALAVAGGAAGNFAGGALLARGMGAARLVAGAFALAALLALAAALNPLGAWPRYALLVLFGIVSGVVPTALFAQAPAQAPHPAAAGLTVGMMMQGNNLGLVAGPPVGAALAAAGGWPTLAAGVAIAYGVAIAIALAGLRRATNTAHSRHRIGHSGA